MKISRIKSTEKLTEGIRTSNKSDVLLNRLRGNERIILKRMLFDFINASQQKRIGTMDDYQRGSISLPCIIEQDRRQWLITSPALISHVEDRSMTPRTVANWLARWKESIDAEKTNPNPIKRKNSMIQEIVRPSDTCDLFGNDTAILLMDGTFELMEEPVPMPSPHKPPDLQGKADIEGIKPSEMVKAAERFNKKHHVR